MSDTSTLGPLVARLMSEAGSTYEISPDYRVALPPGDIVFLCIPTFVGTAASEIVHANIIRRTPRLLEFKHSSSGRKWWTRKAGIVLMLAIPKSEILLLPKEGHSYVPVSIAGVEVVLNVSGGGGSMPGWTDHVPLDPETCVGYSVKAIRTMADRGIPLSELHEASLPPTRASDLMGREAANVLIQSRLIAREIKPGDPVVLAAGISFPGAGPDFYFKRFGHGAQVILGSSWKNEAWSGSTARKSVDWVASAALREKRLSASSNAIVGPAPTD